MVPQYVGIGPSTHRTDACIGLFPLKSDFSQCAADAAALFEKSFVFGVVCVCVGGGGVMPTVRVACRTTAPYSCAAPVALQLAARHRSSVSCHALHRRSMDVVRCMLHVACCMLRVACRPSLVACCVLPPEHAVSARTHARAQCARADALVRMAVADEAVGRTPLVICAFTLRWPQLPRHIL